MSYGVPGLRLGIVASGDNELISFIKQDVGIWNINSFAEFYMQIAEKYQKDYVNGLKQFKTEKAVVFTGGKIRETFVKDKTDFFAFRPACNFTQTVGTYEVEKIT